MNLMNKPPMGLKQKRPPANPEYLQRVRELPCAACGCHGSSEAHHPKDRPPFEELGTYKFFPGYGQRSADEDAIPLCPPCHRLYHLNPEEFHEKYGPDYQFIPSTRAQLEDMELDY